MVIVVNCRFLTQEVTGVQRFAEEVATALVGLRDDIVLVAPPGRLRVDSIKGAPVQQIGRRSGHLWEQIDLPLAMRRKFRGARLLSLMNTGPAILRDQVVTHHDVTYVRWPSTYSWKFRLAYRTLSTFTLRSAQQVVTVSEFSKREIAAVYRLSPAKITVVPNAASEQLVSTEASQSPSRYFLAVASLLPHKNLRFLVDTFARYVETTGSSSRLLMVGSRPESLAGGVDGSGSPDHPQIEWMGRVSDARLAQLYAGARALVFPSLYEGFGVPPLEAQANGCPVVSTTAASLPEVLGSSALFFDPTAANELIDVLGRVDHDDHEVDRLRALGSQNVARFSWERSARILSQVLDQGV